MYDKKLIILATFFSWLTAVGAGFVYLSNDVVLHYSWGSRLLIIFVLFVTILVFLIGIIQPLLYFIGMGKLSVMYSFSLKIILVIFFTFLFTKWIGHNEDLVYSILLLIYIVLNSITRAKHRELS